MAPKRTGGRPGNKWTQSRRRKLVRLCSFTNLSIEDIRKVLQGDGFNPCIRDYKTQLKRLFPSDYASEWRRYRPADDLNARSRFSPLKHCKDGRVAKGRRLRLNRKVPKSCQLTTSNASRETSAVSYVPSPWYNPLINYHGLSLIVEPSVCPKALQQSNSNKDYSNSDQSPAPLPNRDAEPTADSVVALEHLLHPRGSSSGIPDGLKIPSSSYSPASSMECETSQDGPSERFLRNSADDIRPSQSEDAPRSQPRDSHMLIKGKSSTKSSSLSIRSLERRLAGRVGSDTLAHVNSLLRYSSSNSWRSSIISYASSWKSHGSSIPYSDPLRDGAIPTTEPDLSTCEQRIWDDLVDETQLAPSAQSRPIHEEISLTSRPCCLAIGPDDYLDLGPDHTILCSTCHFSIIHNQGRHCVEILNQGFDNIIFPRFVKNTDFFGNTALHFAAASQHIKIAAFKSIITNGVNVNARNTSGENFMHVLNMGAIADITEYIDLLRFLENHDFQFADRDYHGRTVAHKFFLGSKLWEIELPCLEEILTRLRVNFREVDNLGYDFGIGDLVSSRMSDTRLAEKETVIYTRISLLATRFHDQGLVMVNYHAQLQSVKLQLNKWADSVWRANYNQRVDINGDTPLTAIVKYWPDDQDERQLHSIIHSLVRWRCDVHARDRRGCTALAIATGRGLRPAVSTLLEICASVNTRCYRGISTLSRATMCLKQAQKTGNDRLYGMIVSCISLITDWGAKMEPTIYDEYIKKMQQPLPPYPSPAQQSRRVYKGGVFG